MKKVLSTLLALSIIGTSLISASAMALPGEVEKDGQFANELSGVVSYIPCKVITPEKYKDLVPVLKSQDQWGIKTAGGYTSKYEDVVLDGQTYRWLFKEDIAGSTHATELVLYPASDPYYEPIETLRILYSDYRHTEGGVIHRFKMNNPNYGKDATQMKLVIDNKAYQFKTAYYPKCVLFFMKDLHWCMDKRIPMVGVREFVDSFPELSLTYDNGVITIHNSKFNTDAKYSIYMTPEMLDGINSTDVAKAILKDSTSYASMGDLLETVFFNATDSNQWDYKTTDNVNSQNLIFCKWVTNGDKYLQFADLVRAISQAEPVVSPVHEAIREWNDNKIFNFWVANKGGSSWNTYKQEASYKLIKAFEDNVNPQVGCIYKGSSLTKGNEEWVEPLKSLASTVSTDKEKAEIVYDYLVNNLGTVGLTGVMSAKVHKADGTTKDIQFYGFCEDLVELHCRVMTELNIPSIKLRGIRGAVCNAEGYTIDSQAGHAITGIYYDNAWHYYDSAFDKKNMTTEEASDYLRVDDIEGLGNPTIMRSAEDTHLDALAREATDRASLCGYAMRD